MTNMKRLEHIVNELPEAERVDIAEWGDHPTSPAHGEGLDMTTMAEQVMRRFYRHARGAPERLPWHREAPSSVLVSAVKARDRHGLALDVGCGAGVFSIWLAGQGMT